MVAVMTQQTRARRRAQANQAVAQVMNPQPAEQKNPKILLGAFKENTWYEAIVTRVEPCLGPGFFQHQRVPFKVTEYEGQPQVRVFNMNYAIRVLTAEEAKKSLRTVRRRLGAGRVAVDPLPDQSRIEDKYQWELNY